MVASQVRVLFVLSVIFVSVGSAAIAGGLSATAAPVSVRMALRANTITLGEPVVLDYDITDSVSPPITVDLGKDQESWLSVSIAPLSAARRAVAVRSPEPLRIGGISTSRVRSVTHRSSIHDHVVVSRRSSFVGPGRYTLQVESEIPYLIGAEAGTVVSLRPGYLPFTAPTGVVRVTNRLTLVVKPENVARLHKTARSLISAATVRGRNVVDAVTAIQSLFTMPPKIVAGEWLALFQNEGLGFQTSMAIQELTRTGSPQAADILEKLNSDAKRPAYVRATARAGLLHMWKQGDVPLKHRIADHFIKTEGRMPSAASFSPPPD